MKNTRDAIPPFGAAHGSAAILKQLRFSGVEDYELDPGVCKAAANEIERLRAALECVRRNTETRHIETLRAAKDNMKSAWIAATVALEPPNVREADENELEALRTARAEA
jgi:hypothetical protein